MAITVTSATYGTDGTVTVLGSEFTKTTTAVYVDDVTTPFTWVDANTITLTGVGVGALVEVEKAGTIAEATVTAAAEEPAVMVDDPAPADSPEVTAIAPGTWPSPIDGFRAAVAGVALVGLIPVGDEKTPYPTGTPLAAGSKFWLREGFYKSATPT